MLYKVLKMEGKYMIKHIVMYKLKDNTEQNAIALRDKFLGMKGKIDVLKDIESGVDILHTARSYDVVLVCTFESREDMETYQSHPVHIPVKEYVGERILEAKAVDFEY